MISGRFLFGIFAFCLLWIWMFSGHSQKKRSITVKSDSYEITNSLSNYLVSELPENDAKWFPLSKLTEQFAGVSFEVIPAIKNNKIIVALFFNQGGSLIFFIQWNNETITVNYKINSKSDKSMEITYKDKFTFEIKMMSYVLRAQICSNNKCASHYLNYQTKGQTKFSNFLISLSTKNSAFIRNFKLQKFLANPNIIKYFPISVSYDKIIENFPTIKSMKIIFHLKHMRDNQTDKVLLKFLPRNNTSQSDTSSGLSSNTSDLISIQWKEWPSIIDLCYGTDMNLSHFYIPYSDVIDDMLVVILNADYYNSRVTMDFKNKNVTTFLTSEKFKIMEKISGDNSFVSFSINSDQGSLNEAHYNLSSSVPQYVLPKTVYMIAFREIVISQFGAIIKSSVNDNDMNVSRNGCETCGSSTEITFRNQSIKITHDQTNLKPEIEIIFEIDAIYLFTSDGKSGFIKPGIPSKWFSYINLSHGDLKIQVQTIALVK